MRKYLIIAFVSGLVAFATGTISLDKALAQSDSAQPAAEAVSAKPIGRVVIASGSVSIEHVNAVVVQASVGQPDRVKVGDPVYLGDVVATGADGKLGVSFDDGTAFTLSSSARMILNEFVYDPNGKSNSTLFSLTKGTFTFVAGKVAKTGDMKIDTPMATMGIRGTTPHIEIADDGTTRFSTLIEEGKDKVSTKHPAPRGQGQMRTASAGRSGSAWHPVQELSKPNLTICSGSC